MHLKPILYFTFLYITILTSCSHQDEDKNQKYYQQSNSYREANKILSDIRPDTPDEKNNELLLAAAEKFVDASLIKKGINTLGKLDFDKLSNNQSTRLHILKAKIYLNSDQSLKALDELIAGNNQAVVDSELAKTAIDKLSNDLDYTAYDELNLRVKIDQDIQHTPELSEQNNKNIWQRLVTLDYQTIDKLINKLSNQSSTNTDNIENNNDTSINQSVDNRIQLGWLELAKISNQASKYNDQQYIEQLKYWQSHYPNHPARNIIVELNQDLNIYNRQETTNNIITKKIAVLLPLTGNLAPAAKAIKEGLLTAYYNDKKVNKPELIFIDTKNDSNNIKKYYNEAIQEQADLVIGPLNKNSVQNLNDIYDKKVPVIALNYIADTMQQTTNSTFFQFGLSAENEAQLAALKSWQNGLNNTLIIADDTDWGYRVSKAFKNKFEQLNGKIANMAFINSKTNYKKLIYSTLGIEESQQRKNTLQWIVGNKLSFKPRRHQDFDSIFIVSTSNEAKQIKPILKFYYADDLPIISTSNIFDYKNSKNKIYYKDLTGIKFCDIPLIIHDNPQNKNTVNLLKKNWPDNYDQFIRLYALGIDAYSLSNNMNKMINFRNIGIAANTGHLTADARGVINRQLPWAEINNDGLKVIEVI